MDHINAIKLKEHAEKQIELADEYAETREQAGQMECALELMVADNLEMIRFEKPNVGYDMAILMLIEKDLTARNIFEQWKKLTSKYKGLEKKIEARQSYVQYNQSLMKYIKDGEKYG